MCMGWDHLPTPQYFICPCVFLVPANAAPCGKVTEETASLLNPTHSGIV